VSFQIYDYDCDGLISVADMTAVVGATLREHGVVISRPELDKIVLHTMTEAAPKQAGVIAYDEYSKMVAQKPQMLAHLTLNISSIIVEYTNATAVTFATPRKP
jgi:Ca2+-binding EF-hand superfamily protein